MIHFKVIKASKLLLWLAIIALIAVAGFIALSCAFRSAPESKLAAVRLVEAMDEEAKARAAFASSAVGMGAQADVNDAPGIEVEVVSKPEKKPAVVRKPSVLIYHTHTHEAYDQVEGDPYEAVEAWRTADEGHSVVRVGETLAGHLRAHGFEVVHDTTDHETEALSTAYTRSLKTLKSYDRVFDLYIDLHRDAYVKGAELRHTTPGGTACAQAMLLIGNGNGFDEKPYYEQNLAFARALTDRVNQLEPGLCKRVLVKDGRYNQHIGIFSILIEVGHNLNTLEEALNTTPYLADAIDDLMVKNPDPALEAMAAPARIDMQDIDLASK